MTKREDRLRSLLDKVRAKRPDERETQAADVLERIRTASGAVPAAQSAPATPPPAAIESPVPSDFPAGLSSAPAPESDEPPTSPTIDSPTRYSSQPPHVERPLSVEPRARSVRPSSSTPASSPSPRESSGAPRASSQSSLRRPDSIRAPSVVPTGQPIVHATDQPEFPRAKTFGDLLELTLSLRPR